MNTKCYLIESQDRGLLQKKTEEIITKNQFQDAQTTYYDLEESTLAQVIEDLDTYSFLTPKKVIVISNTLFLSSTDIKFEEKELEHIIRYIENPNPDVLFIMGIEKCDERKKIVKNIKKKVTVITINLDPISYAKELLKDYKIKSDAVLLLVDYCNYNISKITHECEKLKMLSIDTLEIKKEDIEDVVPRSISGIDNLAFDFVKYIAQHDKKKMFHCYEILKENSFDIHAMIGLIESQMRLIYQVLLGKRKNLSKDEIAKLIKEHPYRVQKSLEFLPFYTEVDIQEMIHRLHELDYRIKSGQIEATIGFEMFLIHI